jgi:hypothetical protein
VHLTLESDGRVAALGNERRDLRRPPAPRDRRRRVTVSDSGFLTLTFARTGAAWEIVAEHYSYRAGP